MRPVLFLTSCMAACCAAAPIFDSLYDFSEDMAEFLGRVSRGISKVEDLFDSSLSCNPSSIALPSFASGLPAPTGQTPLYVAVGRGTQNYTCATSTKDSKPEANGAVARLYNATCIAANFPDLIELLPAIAYKVTLPSNEYDPLPPANLGLIGHHFFQGSTPVFNLDTTPSSQLGLAISKKVAALDAPSNAIKGSNGAVAWLYLSAINGTVGAYKSVYRVDTAGGNSPETCEGMPSAFTVQYAANYFFYES
ncbi:hypothetical protein P175DRAFT_0555695 [Aspergillus ochraceoroseus IBT 24754]|uniref:Uncharacterized protein n=3 Tax=Aspergillus subgen. Nidulantes TaxID=2720870 RepID=A0A0F8X3B2_9EURO|nr:uncharacterized protein P175DRAFT_0555695 [Aspergillus ochraceoroseus IBT 24754]KKK16143.1 hypothetical protein AOCH_004901 [Aspergillus ochraceoroseus]KKK18042.1 hypothetical protein ARAM_000762 [Aspergillus rambellii]PTU23034.1 hypothetical protein P175DRAFT_0555695 [Aspergillus ochraceoroseus IBT 24754]